MQVRVPKTVDRLFGIPDQKHQAIAGSVDLLEDGELQRIGVLEFVDQRRGKARAERRGQPGIIRMMQAFMEIREHVVEGHYLPRTLQRSQPRRAFREQALQQPAARQKQGVVERFALRQIGFGVGEEGVRRGDAFLLGLAGEAARAKQMRLLADCRERIVVAAQDVPIGRCALQRGRFIGITVELAERRGEQRADFGLVGQPMGPGRAIRFIQQRRGQRRGREIGRPDMPRQRLRQVAFQKPCVLDRRVLARGDVAGELGGGVVRDVAAPEVVHRRGEQIAIAVHEFGAHGQAGSEGIVGECALAKAVNGEDGGLIEGMQREFQACRERATGHPRPRQEVAGQPADEGGSSGCRRTLEKLEQLANARADALAQLRGGRVGEGHHEQLLHRQLALEQQAQVQAADRPGLAGAGGRLDQVHARERAGKDIERCGRADRGIHRRASSR